MTKQDFGYIVWGALAAIVVVTEVMAKVGSTWLRLTRNQEFRERARPFAETDPDTTRLSWTDAVSSLMAVLKPE